VLLAAAYVGVGLTIDMRWRNRREAGA
jgi:hypothetical protein